MEIKETKQCPYCGEEILAIAKKCRCCGEWLDQKEYIRCSVCGEKVEKGTEKCPACHERLYASHIPIETNVGMKTCTICGEEILEVAQKCKHCGEWQNTAQKVPKKVITCPTCGENVEEGTKVCPYCNEPIVINKAPKVMPIMNKNQTTERPSKPAQPQINVNVKSYERSRVSDSETSFDRGFGGAMGGCTGVLAFFILLCLFLSKCSEMSGHILPKKPNQKYEIYNIGIPPISSNRILMLDNVFSCQEKSNP